MNASSPEAQGKETSVFSRVILFLYRNRNGNRSTNHVLCLARKKLFFLNQAYQTVAFGLNNRCEWANGSSGVERSEGEGESGNASGQRAECRVDRHDVYRVCSIEPAWVPT